MRNANTSNSTATNYTRKSDTAFRQVVQTESSAKSKNLARAISRNVSALKGVDVVETMSQIP